MSREVDVERCAWYLSLLSSKDGPLRFSSRSFDHFGQVASWRSSSSTSLEARLRFPIFDFPRFLTPPWWCVHTPDFAPGACGPYRVATLVPGASPLKAFYLLSPASKERDSDPLLEFSFHDSPDHRIATFLERDADVLVGLAGSEPSRLASLAGSGARILSSACDVLPVIAARGDTFPGDSPHVMRALKSLVDPPALASSVYGPHARPAWHSVVPDQVSALAWSDQALSPSDARLAVRRALSAAGVSLRIGYSLPSHRRLAEGVASQWERALDAPVAVERVDLIGGDLHAHPLRVVPITLRSDPRTLFRVLFDPAWSDLVWDVPPMLRQAFRALILARDARTYAASLSHLCVLFSHAAPCLVPVIPSRLDAVAPSVIRSPDAFGPPGSIFSPRAFLSALGVSFPT